MLRRMVETQEANAFTPSSSLSPWIRRERPPEFSLARRRASSLTEGSSVGPPGRFGQYVHFRFHELAVPAQERDCLTMNEPQRSRRVSRAIVPRKTRWDGRSEGDLAGRRSTLT